MIGGGFPATVDDAAGAAVVSGLPMLTVVFRGAFARVAFVESGWGPAWWFVDGDAPDIDAAEWNAIEAQVAAEIGRRRDAWNALGAERRHRLGRQARSTATHLAGGRDRR